MLHLMHAFLSSAFQRPLGCQGCAEVLTASWSHLRFLSAHRQLRFSIRCMQSCPYVAGALREEVRIP